MKKENKTEDTRTEDTKAEEVKANDTSKATTPKMRRIIIEFNEKVIDLKALEVSSQFELQGIFDNILKQIR